ncbi:phage major capsid protein [Fictibacillus phosphorivorans]|uniref:phage major capsid protein n=1 Tax=Fictibacillus phosphorivorans TaxID=1221500 RepID=UPI003CF6227B
MKMELRTNKVELSSDGKELFVSGYVNKPGQLSQLLGGTRKFKEKISKGAFQKAIENRSKDIEFLAEHNNKLILASTRNGSLSLTEDDEGLFMSAKITPTSYGKDYYELIKSGLIGSMSFGFRALKDSWQHVEGVAIRTVEQLELFEVSAVKEPAYIQSSIAARGIDLIEKINVPEEQKQTERGNLSMEKVIEKRTMETAEDQFASILKGEVRDNLQMTGHGGAVIPENVEGSIIKKMEETSPAFAAARKFNSTSGTLKIAKEAGFEDAGFVGEGIEVGDLSLNITDVKLNQKRVGAALALSNNLILDDAADISGYAQELLSRRMAKAVEKSMFLGSEVEEFRGIKATAGVKDVELSLATGVVDVDLIADMHLGLNPVFLDGAMYVMSRAFFNQIAKLKDANGHFYVQKGSVNGKFQYTLQGFPVHVSDVLDAGATVGDMPVVFGNFGQAYGIMVKKGMGVTKVAGDTTQALRGSVLYVADAHMDGAVINEQALARLIVKA